MSQINPLAEVTANPFVGGLLVKSPSGQIIVQTGELLELMVRNVGIGCQIGQQLGQDLGITGLLQIQFGTAEKRFTSGVTMRGSNYHFTTQLQVDVKTVSNIIISRV